MMRSAAGWLVPVVAACVLACAGGDADNASPDAARPPVAVPAERTAGDTVWPAAPPVSYARTATRDLTGDGSPEQLVVAARGARWDSLDITLTVRTSDADTLLHEQWNSQLYFVYEPAAGKPDSAVARIVRDHVLALLSPEKFSAAGYPAGLRHGDEQMRTAMMREAVAYHLAELDWRRAHGLQPWQPLPPGAYDDVRTTDITDARLGAVLAEVRERPMFMHFGGGEATYAWAWSDREAALIRTFSCC